MKKILATLLLSSCLLLTGCSTTKNEETKELEEIQKNIEDADIDISYFDDFIALDLSKVEYNGQSLNQALLIGLSDDLKSVDYISLNYDSETANVHYRGMYIPSDRITVASVDSNDVNVCSNFVIESQEVLDDSTTCDPETIEYINSINGILENVIMKDNDLSYDKLEKWAPWAFENNSK